MDWRFLRLLCVALCAFSLGLFLPSLQVWADDDAIIDVDDGEYFTRTGTWNSSSFLPCAHGGAYQFAWGSGNTMTLDTDTANPGVFPDIPGEYMVYAMWSAHPNRNNAVSYKIYEGSSTLLSTRTVDQRTNGCQWNYLATVTLSIPSYGRVIIDSGAATAGEATIADGVRWVRVTKDSDDILDNTLIDVDMRDEAGVDWASGEQLLALSGTDTVVRSITVTAPTSGYVVVHASGYFLFSSTGNDGGRCSITTGSLLDFSHLIYAEDIGDSVARSPFSATRGYSVGSGSTTFRLVCDESSGTVEVSDSSITATFTPTRY